MKLRVYPHFLSGLLFLAAVSVSNASIVFKPGEKAKYVAPGEEEISGDAQQLITVAHEAEQKGNLGRAIKANLALVKKYPKDGLAAPALYHAAQLLEQTGDHIKAAGSYRRLVERYPASPNFAEAIEAQFRIGEMYLGGKKLKILGIPMKSSLDKAVDIFAAIVRTAPYGRYTARAQFAIGLVREKQGSNDAALQAYQAVIDKFPDDPVAADAQYQIGYIWFAAARKGTTDLGASQKAKTGFQDFLFRYPNSEKAAQARENLALLNQKQTSSAFQIARFYDKQKNFRAAVIYYNDVIRQQPGSNESGRAQKRIEELRKKFGDKLLQSALATAEAADAKKKKTAGAGRSAGGPVMRGASPNEIAPLPPPETDTSLPPPASLMPDTTGAPDSSASSESSTTETSTGSEASPSPSP